MAMRIPTPSTATRWTIYGVLIGLALLIGKVIERPENRAVATVTSPAAPARPDFVVSAEGARAPQVELERLASRARAATTGNVFNDRSWGPLEAEEARRNVPPPPPPPPPQAPPLPFTFMGKLIDDGKTIVFLTKADRNYVVRMGDTIDGTYRVDEIGEQSMTLTYLPLESKQSLAVGSPALMLPNLAQSPAPTTAPVPTPPAASNEPAKLVWVAPSQVKIGGEFTVEVGLPAGPQPRSGRVELVFDARVLAVLGGATAGPATPSDGASARRAIVDVIGPGFPGAPPTPSEVRFRVLAADPTTTRIGVENLSAVTAAGSPLIVASPSAYRLAVVQGQGTREDDD